MAKTVKRPLVKWLALGSVPSAFAGVLLLRSLPGETDLQARLKLALGAALLLAVVAAAVMVATAAGIAFAFSRPQGTLKTIAALQNVPATSPLAPAVGLPMKTVPLAAL